MLIRSFIVVASWLIFLATPSVAQVSGGENVTDSQPQRFRYVNLPNGQMVAAPFDMQDDEVFARMGVQSKTAKSSIIDPDTLEKPSPSNVASQPERWRYVTLPDGRRVEVPANASRAEVLRRFGFEVPQAQTDNTAFGQATGGEKFFLGLLVGGLALGLSVAWAQGRPALTTNPLGAAIHSAFQKCFSFGGRATRREYWYFFLAEILLGFGAVIANSAFDPTHTTTSITLGFAFGITLIPELSVSIRRLRDAGWHPLWVVLKYGFWLAIFLIALIKPDPTSENSTTIWVVLCLAPPLIYTVIACLPSQSDIGLSETALDAPRAPSGINPISADPANSPNLTSKNADENRKRAQDLTDFERHSLDTLDDCVYVLESAGCKIISRTKGWVVTEPLGGKVKIEDFLKLQDKARYYRLNFIREARASLR